MPYKDKKQRAEANYRWRKANCTKIRLRENRRRQTLEYKDKTKEKRKKLRQKVLAKLGNMCICCGETTFEFLAIDHINGGGRQERLKANRGSEGWSYYILAQTDEDIKHKYQVLCHNCNAAKGYYGECPHNTAASGPLASIDPV